MSRFHSYLVIARRFIEQYNGTEPLSRFLKTQFSKDKKFGSRDRKAIASCCYAFYRSWPWLGKEPSEERLLMGMYLTNQDQYGWLTALRPDWPAGLSLANRLIQLGASMQPIAWENYLSANLTTSKYFESLLTQPGMYLRIRPGKEQSVTSRLKAAGIAFNQPRPDTIELPAQSPVEDWLQLNRDVVVQDWSSQEVFADLFTWLPPVQPALPVWDVCAASGGKSILLYDLLKGRIQLTVTDIRPSILRNLRQRFSEAGVNIYHCATADLTKATVDELPALEWPLIICDVPCSGSGTWARTPEETLYISDQKIESYVHRQRAIVQQAASRLKKDGILVYITCSVFARENEQQVDYITQATGLTCLQQTYIIGVERGSDTMFVAYLKR